MARTARPVGRGDAGRGCGRRARPLSCQPPAGPAGFSRSNMVRSWTILGLWAENGGQENECKDNPGRDEPDSG